MFELSESKDWLVLDSPLLKGPFFEDQFELVVIRLDKVHVFDLLVRIQDESFDDKHLMLCQL